MKTASSVVDCIGNTPLIRLNHLSERTGCEILGKAEFMNPGGSVKDRAALGSLAARLSRERQATPVSAWRWWAARWVIAASSSCRTIKADQKSIR